MALVTRLPLLALMATGCALSGDSGATVKVEGRAAEDVFLLSGELRALLSVEIVTPRVEGNQPQIKWLAEDGAEVKEGDPVVAFDSVSTLASIEEKRTRLVQAEIQRESRERELAAERDTKAAAVDKAQVEVQKAEVDARVPAEMRSALDWRGVQAALLERQAAVEKAQADLHAFEVSARADLATLRSGEEKARRDLAGGERALAAVSVRSPRSGIVILAQHWRREEDRKLQAGDNVWQGVPVASIPDLSQMEVDARLSEVDHGRVAVGQKARVYLDTWPDRTFAGRVEEVGGVASEGADRSGFKVRISLEETDPALMRPGLSVRVEVVRRRWEQALVVPRSAVRFEGTEARVARRGRAPEVVGIGACTPVECVVESGLSEGDRVRVF